MSSTTMHFGPEWMRTKHQTPARTQPPPSPPPGPTSGASTYSALVSPAQPQQPEKRDETHPFRYSKEELLRIYREGGGKGGLGLEVERWEGVVREVGNDPIGLRDMGDAEKKLFQGPLNSDLRRRQSTDLLSPLSTQGLGNDKSRISLNSPASATGSPLRDRFGALRRDQPSLSIPRKQSLSNIQPASPRDAAPSPRRGSAFNTPSFDGILGGSDSWVARRRASEASLKAGGTSRDAGTDYQPEGKTSDIREEEESHESKEDQHPSGQPHDPDLTTAPQSVSDPPAVDNTRNVVAETNHHSLNGGGTGTPGSLNGVPNPNPPVAVDLTTIEWSYKDPSGQVQGPFNAELMQKWFDDGYFTGDLPMKRTHLDTQWATVDELVKRHGGNKIFITPPVPTIPPGLPTHREAQNFGQDPNPYNGPYQPAPLRNIRSATLDSFGSNTSDSPSSSFGAGRFGSGSPDPNAFGGRGFYGGDTGRGQTFGAIPDPTNAFTRRNNFNDPHIDPALAMRSAAFNNFVNRGPTADGFGYNRTYSPGQGWTSSPFDGNRAIDPFSTPFTSAPTNAFGTSQDVYDNTPYQNGEFNNYVNGPAQPQHYAPSPTAQYQPVANAYGLQSPTPQTVSSDLNPSPVPQSPWNHEAPQPRRPGPFDSVHPTSANTVALLPTVDQSPWGQTTSSQPSRPSSQLNNESSSPWQPPSEGLVEDWKTSTAHDSLTFSNVGQHNEQQQQLANATERIMREPEAVDMPKPPVVEAEPEPTAKAAPPSKHKTKASAPALASATKTPAVPQVSQEDISIPAPAPAIPAPKAAWSKEDEAKIKPSGASVSLREIQEAEAKKAEARKAAERERERVARAAAPVADSKDATQPFTASWGLPTSQAGSRTAAPVKDASAAAPTPTAAAPVWTNAPKTVPVKKTMKEIQEEEEKRKKTAVRETAASAARRAYADTTQKVTPQPAPGSAWTTVGAGGKPAAATPAPVRPAAVSSTSTLNIPSTSARPNNSVTTRPISVSPATKPSTPLTSKGDELPMAPSADFMKWLSTALKGLKEGVNVEEIMEMLISFPVDPDESTLEIVKDIIWTNSNTLDGRRFAADFFSKRKADAAARKGAAAAGKPVAKPVSIADVVKAAPKPTQPEWGFKVVNKKKKGGRA